MRTLYGWLMWWRPVYELRLWRQKAAIDLWMRLARLVPREVQKWVLINATAKVWLEGNITPDEIGYTMLYRAIDSHPGH